MAWLVRTAVGSQEDLSLNPGVGEVGCLVRKQQCRHVDLSCNYQTVKHSASGVQQPFIQLHVVGVETGVDPEPDAGMARLSVRGRVRSHGRLYVHVYRML